MSRLELALGLVALFTATGCSSTSTDKSTPDGAAAASPDASGSAACAALGGQCETSSSCSNNINMACDPGAGTCCLDHAICPDGGSHFVPGPGYDVSCTTDSDCVTVAAGDACFVCEISCQTMSAAINTAALPRYMADLAPTLAAEQAGAGGCFCPASTGLGAPCCHGGMCSTDKCVAADAADAGDACAAAGGKCFFGGQLSCSIVGSQDCGSQGFCCLDSAFASDAAAK